MVIGSPEDADIFFVNMTPGWHITTRHAAIFYHPANNVQGDYVARTSIYLFGTGGRDREAYGLFLGGRDLDTPGQSYIYFLIRNAGDFLIKSRTGDETTVIEDWQSSEAIVINDNTSGTSVLNELVMRVQSDTLTFEINGVEVASHSPPPQSTDGIMGLRVNHGLNMHVADLRIEEL
jgi:hypothetical protein